VKNKQLQWTRPIFILAGTTIEAHTQNDGISASSFSVATHQQLLISVPSINIVSYAHLFTFHLLFIQHPQIEKTPSQEPTKRGAIYSTPTSAMPTSMSVPAETTSSS
jgi:hypothetical protein